MWSDNWCIQPLLPATIQICIRISASGSFIYADSGEKIIDFSADNFQMSESLWYKDDGGARPATPWFCGESLHSEPAGVCGSGCGYGLYWHPRLARKFGLQLSQWNNWLSSIHGFWWLDRRSVKVELRKGSVYTTNNVATFLKQLTTMVLLKISGHPADSQGWQRVCYPGTLLTPRRFWCILCLSAEVQCQALSLFACGWRWVLCHLWNRLQQKLQSLSWFQLLGRKLGQIPPCGLPNWT